MHWWPLDPRRNRSPPLFRLLKIDRQLRSRIAQSLDVPAKTYASAFRSLRPCWTAILNNLRGQTIQAKSSIIR
jgi:hypothetical protein